MHRLDRVIFIPCHVPPHKEEDRMRIVPAEDRLHMTRLACAGNPRFEVSDLEVITEGPSYTVNTLTLLSQRLDWEPFFILGTDSLHELPTWKDFERLFRLSHFIAVTRPGIEFRAAWCYLPEHIRSQFIDRGEFFLHRSGRRLIPSRVKGLDVSSTQIRNLLTEGDSIRYLVPEEVRSYIFAKGLYRN